MTAETGQRWTLRGTHTEYTVTVPAHGRWLELVAWGPHGVSDGPSPVAYDGPVPFLTAGDAAPIEYATDADRPFTGADLVIETSNGQRRVGFVHTDARIDADQRELAVDFADPVTGLRATVHYRVPAGTDVVQRWVELTNDGTDALRVVRAGSGGFCVPTPHGALLSHQWGQWAQEFQLSHVELGHGALQHRQLPGRTRASARALAGRARHRRAGRSGLGDGAGLDRLVGDQRRAGHRRPDPGPGRPSAGRRPAGRWPPGERLTLPVATGAYSPDGLDGLARVWHTHQRLLAADRLSASPGALQLLGGDLLRRRGAESARARPDRRRAGRRDVRRGRRLVRRAATTTPPGSATGRPTRRSSRPGSTPSSPTSAPSG